jgi:hypothetical protein
MKTPACVCHTSAAAHEPLRRGYSAWPDREPAVGGSKMREMNSGAVALAKL